MRDMNDKKLYVWKLASFLRQNKMTMSGEELASHLNRNKFLTDYGTAYAGGRGIYKLIHQTWKWLDRLALEEEAEKVPKAFVAPDGKYPYNK